VSILEQLANDHRALDARIRRDLEDGRAQRVLDDLPRSTP
jgi:hypothetical protein